MRTLSWDPEHNTLRMIDQRLLPSDLRVMELHSPEQVAEAIRDMAVRGAPAIGAAAAYGMALAAIRSEAESVEQLMDHLRAAGSLLGEARPTAVNLSWAIRRMLAAAEQATPSRVKELRERLILEAESIAEEDVAINRRIGSHGAKLLPDAGTVIHHCNTGALATVDYGTALGVIRMAHEVGKDMHVLVDETRPRLQGAMLTAWELDQYGIPYEIIADGAAGHFLRSGEVSAVLVGADRVAANGDVANKIGTYMLALAAEDNQVPFYCAVPTSSVDLDIPSGEGIEVEERDPKEVTALERGGRPVAPPDSQARNPAFDITPHRLVTAFITEIGVITPPYPEGLRAAVEAATER